MNERENPNREGRSGFVGIFNENAGMPAPGMVPMEEVAITNPELEGSDLTYEGTGIERLALWLNTVRPPVGSVGFAVPVGDRLASWPTAVPACIIHVKAILTAARGWLCYIPNDSWPSPGFNYLSGVDTFTDVRDYRFPRLVVRQGGVQKANYYGSQNADGSWTIDSKHPQVGLFGTSSGPLTAAGTYDFEFHFPGHTPVVSTLTLACGDTHDFGTVNLPTYNPAHDLVDKNVFFNANTNIGRILSATDELGSFDMVLMPMPVGPATYPPFIPATGGGGGGVSWTLLDNDHPPTTHLGYPVPRMATSNGLLHGFMGYHFNTFGGEECLYLWFLYPGNNIREFGGAGIAPPPGDEWSDTIGVTLMAGRYGITGLTGGSLGYQYNFKRRLEGGGISPDVFLAGYFSIRANDYAARPIAWNFSGLSKQVVVSAADPAFDCVGDMTLSVTKTWAGWPPSL